MNTQDKSNTHWDVRVFRHSDDPDDGCIGKFSANFARDCQCDCQVWKECKWEGNYSSDSLPAVLMRTRLIV